MVAFACFCHVFFHCHVKLPASIAAICPLGGAVTWASNGETCCTTTLSAGVPDWFGKQFLDVFGLLSFPRFPKVSQGFQGFPRFPKSQNSVLSPNHLFKYCQDDRSHCDRRNLVGELQELTRQASEQISRHARSFKQPKSCPLEWFTIHLSKPDSLQFQDLPTTRRWYRLTTEAELGARIKLSPVQPRRRFPLGRCLRDPPKSWPAGCTRKTQSSD